MSIRNVIGILLIFFSITTFAGGTCCGSHWAWSEEEGHCSTCQCTDLGRHNNTCMSDGRFCEAFGNPGGR